MKIAVITGASSGLGCEFVKAVAEQICGNAPRCRAKFGDALKGIEEIWLIARRKQRLAELKEKYEAEFAKKGFEIKVRPLALDITSESSIEILERELRTADADIRLLVNNAGCGIIGNFDEMETKGQVNMVMLNNVALTAITSVALGFTDRGSVIINTCSIASFAPNPRMTVYCSAKAYVLSFSKSLRFELRKKGINVLAVCPGPMDTEFLSVAGIQKGTSKTFDTLPRTSPELAAKGALRAALRGNGVYTPRMFYKFYRVLAKVLPHGLVMYMSKT